MTTITRLDRREKLALVLALLIMVLGAHGAYEAVFGGFMSWLVSASSAAVVGALLDRWYHA